MKPPTSPSLFLFVCFSFAELFVVSLFRIGSDPASSEFWKEKEQKYVRGAQPYFLGGFFFLVRDNPACRGYNFIYNR